MKMAITRFIHEGKIDKVLQERYRDGQLQDLHFMFIDLEKAY